MQMLVDIRPNEDHAKQYVAQRQTMSVVQVMPELSEHEVRPSSLPVLLHITSLQCPPYRWQVFLKKLIATVCQALKA